MLNLIFTISMLKFCLTGPMMYGSCRYISKESTYLMIKILVTLFQSFSLIDHETLWCTRQSIRLKTESTRDQITGRRRCCFSSDFTSVFWGLTLRASLASLCSTGRSFLNSCSVLNHVVRTLSCTGRYGFN